MKGRFGLATCALLILSACGSAESRTQTAPTEVVHQHAVASAPAAAPATAPISTSAEPAQATEQPAISGPAAASIPAATAAPTFAAAASAPAATPAPVSAKPVPTITMAPTAAPVLSVPGLLGKTSVAVKLNDTMTITLSQVSVPEGTVIFTVKNSGSVIHDLIVLKTSLVQNQIPNDPTQPARAQQPGLVGEVSNLAPGASATLTLSLPAGNYVLMCNQPAHYIAGMHAAFTVTGTAAAMQPAQ